MSCKTKTNTKPRFKLSTDSSIRGRQRPLQGHGKSARYVGGYSFASCHHEAGAIMLHGDAEGDKSRIRRSTFPEAQSTELKDLKKK